LLDSTNELNDSFFVLFAQLIDSQIDNNKICDLLGINQKSVRTRIRHLSNSYVVRCEPEYHIKDTDGRKQIPDILVTVSSRKEEDAVAYIIIENKIKKSAIKEGQVDTQFEYFTKYEDKSRPVYSVLITPDEKAFEQLYKSAKNKNSRTAWLKWINHSDDAFSIESILRQLIQHEHNAEIEPIDPNTQFIIKSFIDYIASEFSLKENGKMNFSYKGFETVDEARVVIDGIEYYIKRFSNNMIRLFDNENNLLDVEVKPVLRNVNEKCKLEIGLNDSTGKAKNTQVLGREIINGLKKTNTL
jgi:hypothetical protein